MLTDVSRVERTFLYVLLAQMLYVRADAKSVHPRYGSSSLAAEGSTLLNSTIVAVRTPTKAA